MKSLKQLKKERDKILHTLNIMDMDIPNASQRAFKLIGKCSKLAEAIYLKLKIKK